MSTVMLICPHSFLYVHSSSICVPSPIQHLHKADIKKHHSVVCMSPVPIPVCPQCMCLCVHSHFRVSPLLCVCPQSKYLCVPSPIRQLQAVPSTNTCVSSVHVLVCSCVPTPFCVSTVQVSVFPQSSSKVDSSQKMHHPVVAVLPLSIHVCP